MRVPIVRVLTTLLLTTLVLAPALPMASHASAQDGERPRVYIISVPMNDGLESVATRSGAAARAALRNIDGVDWQHADQRFLGYDDSALSVIDSAREQLNAGRDAYLELDLDTAIATLSSSVESFDAAAAALEDPDDLGQALLLLGASYGFNQQNREARAVFGRLHRQMPHIQPDPDTFPPEVVQLYEASRPRDARRPPGSISIDSNPQGAIAYVDFLARGRTPLVVDQLTTGEHVVRVTRPGAIPFVETVNVPRRGRPESSAYLVDDPDLEGLSDLLAEVPSAGVESIEDGNPIHTIATRLELDKIGVIRVSDAGGDQVALELLLFDVQSGRRLVRGEGGAPTDIGQLESRVSSAVTGAFEAAIRPTQVEDTESIPAVSGDRPTANNSNNDDSGPGAPFYEEWWFWTIIGGVVVGGIVAGVVAGVVTQGPPLGEDPGGQVVFTF
ncbi:MAG: PEGA domain-containing protein [Sandaracinaceae bacterium]